MNEFSTYININQQDLYQDDWVFGLKIAPKTEFEFLNCRVMFDRGNDGRENECLKFKYFTEGSDADDAKKNIEIARLCLSYLVGFPLEDYGFINKKENIEKPMINKNRSYKKVEQISSTSKKILKFKGVKELFFHNIKLINMAQHYQYMYGFNEESFLNYFKIIENISKFVNKNKGIEIEEKDLSTYDDDINAIVDKILESYLEIKYPHSKIKNIAKNVKSMIIHSGKEEVFFTISKFLKKHKIDVDSEDLYRAIKVRNDIAHGSYVEKSELEYVNNFILPLAYESISREFLKREYSKICIEGIIEPWGAVYY